MSCEKVTFLIDKKTLAKLSKWEQLRIKFHKVMCNCCQNYEKDSYFLHGALKKISSVTEPKSALDKLEKEQMKEFLRNQ